MDEINLCFEVNLFEKVTIIAMEFQTNEKFSNLHFDGPVVPDEQVIRPISDSMSTIVGLFGFFLKKLRN